MKACLLCAKEFVPNRKEQVYCGISCRQKVNGSKKSRQSPWKNHAYSKRLDKHGYLMMFAGNHPFAQGRKMIGEHTMVMEVALGRRILRSECVHHRNGNKTDNRLENLELMTNVEHSAIHNKELSRTRKRAAGRFA